ncbi:MAG: hypothetical protein GY798_24595 [Hyphomicrobiales bacterium]|nr:hypothetical protein [Hyphomicrobiales bacterium]
MRDTVKPRALPDLLDVDFSDGIEIRRLVRERHEHLFDMSDSGYVDDYMDAVEDLFGGHFPEYQAMDTAYHDITHTLQATLCLAELMYRRHQDNASPPVTAHDFRRALVAVLFHDIGFLKKASDLEGSGAKYTHLHERRSCDFARAFLEERGWPDDDIRFVENLISSTGPRVNVNEIAFRSEIERLMGQAVCTADFVGQISDPRYPDRLEPLFNEFEESYRYQGLSPDKWLFKSYEALLRGTPAFWDGFVLNKLNEECAGLWRHFEHPATGDNPYMASVERNLAIIRERIATLG